MATQKSKTVPAGRVPTPAPSSTKTATKRTLPQKKADAAAVAPSAEQPVRATNLDATPPELLPLAPATLPSTTGTAIESISLLFDPDWYRSQYQDVAAAGLDPIRHFFDNGAREGRQPNAFFDTAWYLANYPDVLASKMNPFLHYLLYGAREGRRARPDQT